MCRILIFAVFMLWYVVFVLGKNLLFKSILGSCEILNSPKIIFFVNLMIFIEFLKYETIDHLVSTFFIHNEMSTAAVILEKTYNSNSGR